MKILGLIFSMRGKASFTARLAELYVARLRALLPEEIEYECITADKMHIEYCRGCMQCFSAMPCPLSGQDDMEILRQKAEDCDLLIFASPVYFLDVSGKCKSFIDRSSDWSHHMPLIGKPCVHITNANQKQYGPLLQYLELFTGQCGALTAAKIGTIMNADEETIRAVVDKAANDTAAALADPLSIPHERQKKLYQGMLNTHRLLTEWRADHPDSSRYRDDPHEVKLYPYSDFDKACHALFGYPLPSESSAE